MEISIENRPYTAFEANGKLYQSKRISFGLTNAVPWFQRIIDDIIERNNYKGAFAYLDNITICGKTKEEHDANLQQFLEAAAKHNLTFNKNNVLIRPIVFRYWGTKSMIVHCAQTLSA